MERKRVLRLIALILVTASMLLTACGGGNADQAPTTSTPADGNGDSNAAAENGEAEAPAVEQPAATLTLEEQIPDLLILHPEGFDIEINAASDTYVYFVPMMVAETTEYMLAELKTLGWTELGKPTVMGHLATLNMQMDKSRLTISMQDNERTETTRIQMVLMEQ